MLSNFINMDPEPFKSCLEQEIGKIKFICIEAGLEHRVAVE